MSGGWGGVEGVAEEGAGVGVRLGRQVDGEGWLGRGGGG